MLRGAPIAGRRRRGRFRRGCRHGDGLLREPPPGRPVLVHLGEHCAQHPYQRLPRREYLHGAAPPLEIAVGALLDVVRAQAPMVGIGEVQVGQGVGLGVLEQIGRLGAHAGDLPAGQVVELAHERGVPLVEHRVQDRGHRRPLLARGGAGGGVPHQVHDASLPCGAREHLLYGAAQPLVGVGGDAEHAVHAPLSQRSQERQPAGAALGVDGVEPEQPPVSVGAGADGGDQRARGHMAAVPALDMGGVQPDVGEGHVGQIPLLQIGHDIVQRLAYAGDLRGAHAVDAQGRGHAPRPPRGNAVCRHLGHRRYHRPVDSRVAHDEVLREVAAAAQLGDAQAYRPHADYCGVFSP